MQKSISFSMLIALLLVANFAFPQRYINPIDEKYVISRDFDFSGNELMKIEIPGSPPPESYLKSATVLSPNAVYLNDVPALTWSFGCFSTAAAIVAGYYDRHGYPNMYTGPTNGGVFPLNNSSWGSALINGEQRSLCPLSATRKGLDGRTTRGHIDDYWVKYGNEGNDPYLTNGWLQHTHSDCLGDFMKTSQSEYDNSDGSTSYCCYRGGIKYFGNDDNEGSNGIDLFFESRGYNVVERYTQSIVGYDGNTVGFSFNDYKKEIDAGRPVILILVGHAVVGVGYDNISQKVYIHNTWDFNIHSMTWGGIYENMQHYSVCVYKLGPSTNNPYNFNAKTISESQIDLNWDLNSNNDPVLVTYSENGVFGIPVNGVTYSAGQSLAGGGVVLYSGTNRNYSHQSLTPSSTYYYKAWSKTSGNYSDGVKCNGNTLCGGAITSFPYSNNFSSDAISPCWSVKDYYNEGLTWNYVNFSFRSINTPTGSNGFMIIDSDYFGENKSQNSDLISPEFNFTGYSNVSIKFSHYFEYVAPSKATFSYSTNGGASWTEIRSWTSSTANSELFTLNLSSQLSGKANVKFKWNFIGTYAWFWAIDDLLVNATALAPDNDNCANARSIVVGSQTNGSLMGATQTMGENPCGTLPTETLKDVWYKFVATSTNHAVTVAPSYGLNTVVNLRQGSCNGTSIGCENSTGNGMPEILTYSNFVVGNTYYVRVYHDGANTTNDFTILVSVPVQPDDFTISNATISTNTIMKGGTVNANCTQCYTGAKLNSQMNSSRMGYYLSSNATFEQGVDLLLTTDDSDLGSDNPCQDESATLTIPTATQPGTYFILFVADDNGQFTELIETNNFVTQQIIVTSPTITDDFYTLNPTLVSNSVIVGGTINANCSQCYAGSKLNSQMNSSRFGYYLSTNTTLEQGVDLLLATDESDLGSDNACQIEDAILTIPSSTQPGTYYLLFVADDNNLFAEQNESNNSSYLQLFVLAEAISDDLYTLDSYLSKTYIQPGEDFLASSRQCYSGSKLNSQMDSPRLGYFLSTNTSYDKGVDILLATDESDLGRDNTIQAEDEVLTIPSSTQPGIYYILFIADFDGQFPEINETNNLTYQSFTVTSVAVSDDFYVGDVSISKSSAVAGEIIDASCIQLYSGIKLNSQLNSSKLGYYLSNNTTFEPLVDVLLATDESDLGSDNLTSVEDASFAIPHGTSIGTYYILFVADYNNQFAEGNELNNVRYKQLSVVVDMSNEDFFLQEAVVNPTMLVAGRTLEVSINQHYAGAKRNAEMGSVTMGYFLSNNPGYDIGIDLMLGSDGSDLGSDVPFNEESATLTIPLGTPAGTYYILFVADFDNKFTETNEGNNLVSKSIFVSDGSNDNDLTISNPTIFPTTVGAGGTIEANNLQCYTGSKLSFEIPDVVQGYYLSTNMSFEPNIDVQLGTNISNLGSEFNCEEENATLTIPVSVQPGNYYILFVPDYNGAISEVDETNNVSPVGVTVSSNTFTVTLVSNPISGGSTLGAGTYHIGEICTLSASPYYGFSFSHWSENGDIISTEPNYQFSVTSNKYLTAVFVQSQGTYVVETSAYPEGNGFTSGDGAYRNGETCTVTATPAECYVFVQWLQDGYPISNNPTYQFVVRENSNLIAHFEMNVDRYLVNTTLEPTIGGRIVSGSISYRCGEMCTLTTEPYNEYYFMYWTENDSVVSLDLSYSFVVNSSKLIQANFIKKPVNCQISTSVSPFNSGQAEGEGLYLQGTTVYLTASPNPGYVFASWKENGNVVSTNKTYSFVASTSRNLIANFVCKKPDQPVTILGKTSICPSEKGVTYTVPADGFSTSYTWLLSNGALGSSNSNSITIDYGDSFDAGTLSVRGENFCGVSSYKIVDISVVDPPQKVGEISGKKEVCQGEASVLYTIPSMPNATSYNWFLPAGATGSSNTNSILVNFGNSAVSGEVSVKGVNDCSESTYSVYEVKVIPVEELGVISGETNVCAGSTVTYSVVANRNVLNYVWTLPGGTIITTSKNSLDYYISGHSSEGVIKVKGKFACGDGPESSLVITCSESPEIGQISGVTAVCQGTTETYNVQNDPAIEEYNWVLPEGAIGSSTSNTITVSFPEVKSGNIRVKGKNSCGFGRENSLFVTVNPIPSMPQISFSNGTLLSNTLVGNQWYWNSDVITGAVNQWYIPNTEGDYFAIVTLNNCSSDQSNILHYDPKGLGSEELEIAIQIFPNPVSDMLYIEFTSPVKGNTNIEIYNCLGKVIYSNIISEQDHSFPVHFSEFPSGVYLIRMQLDKEIVLQKIIKK